MRLAAAARGYERCAAIPGLWARRWAPWEPAQSRDRAQSKDGSSLRNAIARGLELLPGVVEHQHPVVAAPGRLRRLEAAGVAVGERAEHFHGAGPRIEPPRRHFLARDLPQSNRDRMTLREVDERV